jgi:hypothetical protein
VSLPSLSNAAISARGRLKSDAAVILMQVLSA